MMLCQQFLELSRGKQVNKELKLLLIALGLILLGVASMFWMYRGCEQVEYQDLNGSHFMQVCKGE